MKKMNKMVKIATVLVVIFGFIACDDDYNSVGSSVIGDNNFQISVNDDAVVNAVSYNLNAVQTDGLNSNLLGVYYDPVFGQTTANVLTQLSLPVNNPTFGQEAVLDSVVLTLPYYSRRVGTSEGGAALYELDSVFGSTPVRLTVMESNYFLNEFDPSTNFEEKQKYFSNQQAEIESHLGVNLIEDPDNPEFIFLPSPEEVVLLEGPEDDRVTVEYTPRLRIHLKKDFFTENVINKEGSSELLNNSNFQNFLRGLYIKASTSSIEGTMAMFDFEHADAGIRLHYTYQRQDETSEDPNATVETQSSYKIGFGGIRVNLFNNSFTVPNDNNLYISGGEGTATVIDLFTPEQLEEFRANEWLINEASLTFYVNQDVVVGGGKEPERILIYDLEKRLPLIDYFFDPGATNVNPLNAKTVHSGRLQRDDDGEGISYKVRLTEHIHNILNNDSTNVKLGLVVSQNINLVSNKAVKNTPEIETVPETSVLSPEGTVLYGPNATNEEKRLKLRIYYTDTETN